MASSALQTASSPNNIEFVVYIDEDDASFRDYPLPSCFIYVRGPRKAMGDYWNIAYRAASSRASIFMQGGDDVLFRTPGWDQVVRRAFAACPDGILFAHGDDGWEHHAKFGPLGFVSRQWIDLLGYFTYPQFTSDFCDAWLNECANAVGRRLALPFVTEHLHFEFGKAPLDQTYRDRYARHWKDDNEGRWERTKGARKADAEKLRAAMDGSTMADILRRMGKAATETISAAD